MQLGCLIKAPSAAQIAAGNYPKRKLWIRGLEIAIENEKGSTRSGVDKHGKAWRNVMAAPYGYIKGKDSESGDGEHIDVFVGPHPEFERVFIINQVDPDTGKWDEHKCVIGVRDQDEARKLYLSNYSPGWRGLGSIKEKSFDEFKDWIKGDTTVAAKALQGYIAVDLDGTLAHYDGDMSVIGEPVPKMMARVKRWLAEGKQVKIFTARATDPKAVKKIQAWCAEHIGQPLPVTNEKDPAMIALYDDRAFRVKKNKGTIVAKALLGITYLTKAIRELPLLPSHKNPRIRRHQKTQQDRPAEKRHAQPEQQKQGRAPQDQATPEKKIDLGVEPEVADKLVEQVKEEHSGEPLPDKVGAFKKLLAEHKKVGTGVPLEEVHDAPEKREDVTQTDTFKQWFKGSKVVDENGKPLVLYHGTDSPNDFEAFTKTGDIGFHFGSPSQANIRMEENERGTSGVAIIPAYLAIKNPLRIDDPRDWGPEGLVEAIAESNHLSKKEAADLTRKVWDFPTRQGAYDVIRKKLAEKGFDGLVYINESEWRGEGEGLDAYVAFHATQIKSKFNVGTFDPKDPRISKALTVEAENLLIRENKKKPEASQRHKFKAAEWTHKNGHPRCLICGDEEGPSEWCNDRTLLGVAVKALLLGPSAYEPHRFRPGRGGRCAVCGVREVEGSWCPALRKGIVSYFRNAYAAK